MIKCFNLFFPLLKRDRCVSFKFLNICLCSFMLTGLISIIVFTFNPASVFAEEVASVSGVTEPVYDVTLSMELAGRISKIFYKEGSFVKKGKKILELNSALEQLEVQRRKLIWESKAELTSAIERVKTLKSLLESTRALFKNTGSVSKEDLEKKELEYKLAVAEKLKLEMTEGKEGIEYKMAVASLNKRRLISPVNGIITELLLDAGENCEANQPLVHMVDVSRCRIVCNVEESTGRTLKKGQSVKLQIQTGSSTIEKKGKIVFVSPVVDPASSLLKVKAEFENHDGMVRPGVPGTMLLMAY